MDCQTSADVPEASTMGAGGACTNAMVHTLVGGIGATAFWRYCNDMFMPND